MLDSKKFLLKPALNPSPASSRGRIVTVSVRELVAFVLRTGDLGGGNHFAGPNRALEGTRGHQRIQKSRPEGYAAEVTVTHEVERADFILQLKGRIDGVLAREGSLLIEEIKTVSRLAGLEADPLHWGQAKIYAFLYAEQNGFREAEIQLTYLELESFETLEFRERFSIEALRAFFDSVVGEHLEWLAAHQEWIKARDTSIGTLAFPFGSYRPGQRSMAVAVYRALRDRGRLFAEAPTGIGKTLSVLFPALKAMGEGRVEKIFYTTAKTVGRTVAEKTLADLRAAGLQLRSVTITARDKICFNNGQPCDVPACPFAIGYYDRIKAALKVGLPSQTFTRAEIERLARARQVCPFELSLDLAWWADVIICDYNYVFDPFVSLKRFFSEGRHEFAILIDEAHNLVDRAREMFSAELEKEEILAMKSALAADLPGGARFLGRINAQFLKFKKDEEWHDRQGKLTRKDVPENVLRLAREFCREAEAWLARNEPSEFRPALLELYFRFLAFIRISELYDERYVTTLDSETLRLFCIDPSLLIRAALEDLGGAVFFSATLSPIEYFAQSLGAGGNGSHSRLKLDSPFPPENLGILVHARLPTRFRARSQSYDQVADSIAALAGARPGNYLVYFPSYDYLREVLERFRARHPGIETEIQTTGMSEPARERFLARFQSGANGTLAAFAVLGGVFGEGIDLVGDRLIGVVVVGVGLPQICLERDLIREYWQTGQTAREAKVSGFDFSYTYPGMNRVLQAAGRVIRSEKDRGIVLLLDERFGTAAHRALFPPWWRPRPVRNAEEIREAATAFWSGVETGL